MILCCGEALIDMVPSTSVDGDACFVPKAGGAVFNTAIALGRLGTDVGLFTGVSDDLFGQLLRDELSASRVQTDRLAKRDAPSSLAFVELNEGQARYTFYTENAADTSLTNLDIPADLSDIQAMFFGGISLCTDPTASTLHELMRSRANDCIMMIDPNIRPAFITDEASYRARVTDMMAVSDIVKISDEDLNWLADGTDGIENQIAALIEDTEKLVFVTMGSDGAAAYLNGQKVAHAPSVRVDVEDTIGAGDTFNAAILHTFASRNLLSKDSVKRPEISDIQAALDCAVRAAAITVSRKGANPPWAKEMA